MGPAEILAIFESAKGKDAMDYMLTAARAIEQAARREAIEECARIVNKSHGRDQAEFAIRALMGEEGK